MTFRAMGFVGFHNSGKTTLVARLARHLRESGHRTGIIKCAHHGFDLGANDTGKHAATGCPTAGIGPDQTLVVLPRSMSVGSLLPLLDVDVLLVEGGKGLGFLPRIIIPANQKDVAALDSGLACGYWGEGLPVGLQGVKSLEDLAALVLHKGFLLPALDCGECGREDCAGLARDIVAGKADSSDCQARQGGLRISINGVSLALNPFVESIMTSTIRGMLSPLKGYGPGRLDIRVEGRGA